MLWCNNGPKITSGLHRKCPFHRQWRGQNAEKVTHTKGETTGLINDSLQ